PAARPTQVHPGSRSGSAGHRRDRASGRTGGARRFGHRSEGRGMSSDTFPSLRSPGTTRMPFVVAHRGASADRAEHTLAAYELALADGADGLECDVRLTSDGHLVCVHDRTVDRTSDGTGLVSEMTLAQLQELNFGSAESHSPVLTLSELIGLALDWK